MVATNDDILAKLQEILDVLNKDMYIKYSREVDQSQTKDQISEITTKVRL